MGNNPCDFKGANRPVEQVSWNDAQQFLEKLNAKLGNAGGGQMVLPTEAQWEYAARAGEWSTYAGSDQIDEVAWYAFNSDFETRPVATKKANAWGLHDMSGNVWEWCQDWHDHDLSGGTDPMGPASGTARVGRGGFWGSSASDCRAAARNGYLTPTHRLTGLGFRVARSSVP
jgi:formylglycine-generating enzyme required for sulfatase activity